MGGTPAAEGETRGNVDDGGEKLLEEMEGSDVTVCMMGIGRSREGMWDLGRMGNGLGWGLAEAEEGRFIGMRGEAVGVLGRDRVDDRSNELLFVVSDTGNKGVREWGITFADAADEVGEG